MKIILLTIVSNKESWFQEAKALYLEKINHFVKFEVEALKASKLDRAGSVQKKKQESELLLKFLRNDDFVVLMDEKGKAWESLRFAQWFEKEAPYFSSKRLVFVIGGAFGVSDELKRRAQLTLQMGPWTLNHLIAQTVLMEQLYRVMTINKGLPYHNV